jgi:hypothetical protein
MYSFIQFDGACTLSRAFRERTSVVGCSGRLVAQYVYFINIVVVLGKLCMKENLTNHTNLVDKVVVI